MTVARFCCVFALLTLLTQVPSYGQGYRKLHKKAILVDTHNDIISEAVEKGWKFDSDLSGKSHTDLERLKKGGVDVQVFSVYSAGDQKDAFQFANREIDSLDAWVARNPKDLAKVTTPDELRKALHEKKIACMFGVEGGHMIENSLEKLESLAKRGMCYLSLTHNISPVWVSSAKDETDTSLHLVQKGLTDLGKSVVRKLNDLGVLVDVSHTGETAFWDVMAVTSKPIIASHSSVYALAPVFRNLKDDQIKAIAKNGGVIQLNFFAGFLDSSFEGKYRALFAIHRPEYDSLLQSGLDSNSIRMLLTKKYAVEISSIRPPLTSLLDHIDYIVKLVGDDYVGFGSDFDGISFAAAELDDVTDYPQLTKGLLERGYSKKSIKKILGGNFIRVFKANAKPNH